MAYPEYDPNEPSLGQTFADLLRGVKNPKSWQEVGQGIQNTAKVLPSVGESLGRGALVQLPAFVGDVSQTARQIAPETMQNTFGNRSMPTSEEILAKVPRMTPDYQGSQSHEMMGGVLSPAMPYLLRAGAKATEGLPLGNMIKEAQSPFVPNVRAGEEMLVLHNVSPEKLAAAEKLGGMPAPSLAISKTESPIKGFGDITLVGGKEMAIPSKTNPAFKSDAYTKRSPEITYPLTYKSEEKLKDLFSGLEDKIYNSNYDMFHLLDKFKDRADNKLLQAKFLDEKGLLPNLSEYTEKWKQNADIKDLIKKNKDQYDNWVENFDEMLPFYGVDAKAKIFKGYTPSGNRKYSNVNLENVVKEMKGGASSEGYDYGVGNIRALITPKFKNLEEIKNSRNRLVKSEDFDVIKTKADKEYDSIINNLKGINNYDARDALLEVAETKNINALDRVYPNLPKDLKDQISNYMNGLKQMPTEYFEVKPQRAVGINEFKGAIVPSDVSAKTMSVLEKNGIKDIYKYGSADERKSLIQKFGSEMFAGIPVIGLSRKDQLEEQFNKIKK